MPYEENEEGEKIWVDPPKTRTELMLEKFSEEIQGLIDEAVTSNNATATMESQMRVLDLIFRSMATKASERHNAEYVKTALEAQKGYRHTYGLLQIARMRPDPELVALARAYGDKD